MKTIKKLTAKVLEVTVATPGFLYDSDGNAESFDRESSYEILEFENGLIMVEGESTNDWFFADRDSFEPCGSDYVTAIEETGRTKTIGSDALLCSVQGSMSEFGLDSVPAKHLELWK